MKEEQMSMQSLGQLFHPKNAQKKTKSNWHFKGAFCRSLCMWEGQSPFKAMELGSSQKYKMLEATRKIRAVPDYLRTSAIFKDPPSLS